MALLEKVSKQWLDTASKALWDMINLYCWDSKKGMIVQNEQDVMRQKEQGMIAQNKQDVMRQNQQGTISHGQDLVGQCHPGVMGQNVPSVAGVNQSVMIQHNQQGMHGHSQPGAMGQILPTVVTQNLPGMISHGQQKVGSENVTEQQGQNAMAINQNVSNHKQFSLTGQQSPAVMASHPGEVMRQLSSNQAHIGHMQSNQVLYQYLCLLVWCYCMYLYICMYACI